MAVDVMLVPGHSRRYIDFHELAQDAAKEGIDAFYRLRQHWEAQDFDVLIVRDGERFARTQALHAYIVERTIDVGARKTDGWMSKITACGLRWRATRLRVTLIVLYTQRDKQ